jgi:hypothetical protein
MGSANSTYDKLDRTLWTLADDAKDVYYRQDLIAFIGMFSWKFRLFVDTQVEALLKAAPSSCAEQYSGSSGTAASDLPPRYNMVDEMRRTLEKAFR